MSEKLPIVIQNFENLIEDGYSYVDKTRLIYNLVNTTKYCFLSRPRRFGKSLLISRAYFEGKKSLFEGLDIIELEKNWKEYPVLYLDLNSGKFDTKESLDEALNYTLSEWEQGFDLPKTSGGVSIRFRSIISSLAKLLKKP